MLVLSRKKGEKLLIGDEVEITVLEIDGDRVKLGIKAPKGVKILRAELLDEIRGENVRALDFSIKAFEEIERKMKGR
ncbi:carbon storage regulator CsrA [Thermovorax subterraneus]|nr:carbon storage regulator CsrA [Thermovorax subterraneus]